MFSFLLAKLKNFRIFKGSVTYNVPYNYFSIMHYTLRGFSKNKQKTIVPKVFYASSKAIKVSKVSFQRNKLRNATSGCLACQQKLTGLN